MSTSRSPLSRAQADDVAKRLNPREGQQIVFSRSGVVLHLAFEREAAIEEQGTVYVAQRVDGIVRGVPSVA